MLISFVHVFFLLTIVDGLCFTPDGSLSNDVACNPLDSASICCTAGFLCMSNGLCQPPWSFSKGDNKFIRGTCTDKTWGAPECRGFCVKENPSGGEYVMRCANSTSKSLDSWCCADDKCCTNNAAPKLSVGDADVTATAGAKEKTTSTSKASSTSTSSSSSTTTTTSTAAVTTSASASEKDESDKDDNPATINVLAVGLGVGLGAAVIAVASSVGIWMWCRKRRRTNAVREDRHSTAYPKDAYEVPAPNRIAELSGTHEWSKMATQVNMMPVELAGNDEQYGRRP